MTDQLTDGYTQLQIFRQIIADASTICAACGHIGAQHRAQNNRPCGIIEPNGYCDCTKFTPRKP